MQDSDALYRSPISDEINIRFLENHIVIDRPAQAVFDWVTTWGNLPRWLPRVGEVNMVRGGRLDEPSQLGDIMLVDILSSDGTPSKQYTVVVSVPGYVWSVAGMDVVNGKPNERIQHIATFIVTPLSEGRAQFTRIFQSVRLDVINPSERGSVDGAAGIQKGLMKMKEQIEADIPVA